MSSTLYALSASSAASGTLIAARWYDYIPIAIYFAFVIGVGLIARSKAATADGFLTSGRSLPAWVTGIAFVSANLGAVEIMGMSANGAEYGMPTFHYFWIGAVPAMIFLGLVMMPFYYGSKVRSVPEFMLKRYGTAAHLVNALSFALAQLLIAGINLYLLAKIMNWLLGCYGASVVFERGIYIGKVDVDISVFGDYLHNAFCCTCEYTVGKPHERRKFTFGEYLRYLVVAYYK